MYHGFYPYTTSRDVSTAQTIADCALPYGAAGQIIGTCRTYPIRVANRFDSAGNQVGWSGPYYDDQEETSFEAIGQKVELTTVTRLPRRIFTYSKQQIEQAVRVNGITKMFLNFANYATQEKLDEISNHIKSLTELTWLGWGPTEKDVHHV
jgi:adenylosuccinate synthase